MAYHWLKLLHLLGAISWMAGLFYVGRMFVYHSEARLRPEPERGILSAQLAHMERMCFRAICGPALAITAGAAIGLFAVRPELLQQGWMWGKLALVATLAGYHVHCARLMARFAAGAPVPDSVALRAQNEIPTFLMLGIVLLAVFKAQATVGALAKAFGVLTVLIVVGFVAHQRKRARASESPASAGAAMAAGAMASAAKDGG